MKDLEGEIKEVVVALCTKAVDAQDEERYHASNRDLAKVYDLLPEPKSEWKAYTWLLSTMADNHFEQKEYVEGLAKFDEVFGIDESSKENSYLCLRRGQCALELEKVELATEMLLAAQDLGDAEIFDGEHSKYLKFLKGVST